MLDVEVVRRVLKAEQSVVNGLDSYCHVSALSVVIVEIDCQECLDRTRVKLVLTRSQELGQHHTVKAGR